MPTPKIFGDEDFTAALQRLLPQGVIWRRDPNAVLTEALAALAPTYTRTTAAAALLLLETNPFTTDALLVEWEESLGLPDPCTVADPSVAQRKAAVRAKWGARGAITIPYFINLANNLGFTITIDEFKPFSADDPADSPDYGPEWIYAWQINAPAITTHYFLADQSVADDPLQTWDNSELACRIRRDAPAETILIFNFS